MAEKLASEDPATGEEIATVEIAEATDVTEAVEAARAAQPDWAEQSPRERLAVIERFGQLVLERRAEVAELVTRESGKPLTEARLADLLPTLDMVRYLGRHGQEVLDGERFRLENPMLMDRTSRIGREPLGVVGVIAPWNYPLAIPATQTLSALFAGNGVVLKPSELTPLIGQRLVDLLDEAGVPQGLIQLVQGPGEPTGQALSQADLDLLVFTGSVATGKRVSQAAAGRMTPVVLELGGKDPMLVLEDANLDLAARGAVWGAFTNAGQTCAAVERVYVHQDVAEGFLERVVEEAQRVRVGSGMAQDTDMGPLISQEAVARCQEHVADATKKGASVLTGGEPIEELGPRFLEPTVLAEVHHGMQVMREEIFGPLLPVMVVADQAEAVELANDSRYGLTASVWTRDRSRGEAVASKLQAGTVTVNDCVYTFAACETPWGGVKASGVGRTHGRWGLEAMTRVKHVNLARGGRSCSPWYYPYDEDLARMGDEGLEFLYGSKLEGLRVAAPLARRMRGKMYKGT